MALPPAADTGPQRRSWSDRADVGPDRRPGRGALGVTWGLRIDEPRRCSVTLGDSFATMFGDEEVRMTDRLSPTQFHESAGVEDWRVLGDGACAYFRIGSFAAGARLVQAISELPDVDDHHPDVDV